MSDDRKDIPIPRCTPSDEMAERMAQARRNAESPRVLTDAELLKRAIDEGCYDGPRTTRVLVAEVKRLQYALAWIADHGEWARILTVQPGPSTLAAFMAEMAKRALEAR